MAKNREKAGAAVATAVEPDAGAGDLGRELGVGGGGWLESARPHVFKILVVIAGVGLALGAASVYSWMGHRRDAKATQLFGEVTDVLGREVKVVTPPVPGAEPPPVAPVDPDAEPTFANPADKANAALAAIGRLQKEAGASGVAKDATLLAAAQLYDLGKWDEAAAGYRDAATKVAPALRQLAHEGLGYALEAKALASSPDDKTRLLGEARTAFAQIQPDEKGPGRDLALYHQARVLAQSGKREDAVKELKTLVEKFPTSELVPEAKTRLAGLEAE